MTGDEEEDNQRISRVDTRDVTGDGTPDTGVLNSGESRNFILRVTPTSTAAGTDTTRISGVSVLDKGVDAANNTTHFIDRTTVRGGGGRELLRALDRQAKKLVRRMICRGSRISHVDRESQRAAISSNICRLALR